MVNRYYGKVVCDKCKKTLAVTTKQFLKTDRISHHHLIPTYYCIKTTDSFNVNGRYICACGNAGELTLYKGKKIGFKYTKGQLDALRKFRIEYELAKLEAIT